MNLVGAVTNTRQNKKLYISTMERNSGFQLYSMNLPHIETAVYKNPLGLGKPVAIFKMIKCGITAETFHSLIKQIIQNEDLSTLFDGGRIQEIANACGCLAIIERRWQLICLSKVIFVILTPNKDETPSQTSQVIPEVLIGWANRHLDKLFSDDWAIEQKNYFTEMRKYFSNLNEIPGQKLLAEMIGSQLNLLELIGNSLNQQFKSLIPSLIEKKLDNIKEPAKSFIRTALAYSRKRRADFSGIPDSKITAKSFAERLMLSDSPDFIERAETLFGNQAKYWQAQFNGTPSSVDVQSSSNETNKIVAEHLKQALEDILEATKVNVEANKAIKEEWKQFRGKDNTPEVLGTKAHALAPLILRTSLVIAKSAAKFQDQNDKLSQLFMETVLFFLHLADRSAFEHLDQSNENSLFFSDALCSEIQEILLKSFWTKEFPEEVRRNDFAAIYNARQAEYANVKRGLFSAPNENIAGSLSWVFGEKIAGILAPKQSEMDLLIIPSIQGFLLAALVQMNLPALFGKAS